MSKKLELNWTLHYFFSGQVYGHIHQDKIKLQYHSDKYLDSADKSFLLTSPSVTPVYGNNPAFRVYDFDPHTNNIVDYTQHYLDLSASNCKFSILFCANFRMDKF